MELHILLAGVEFGPYTEAKALQLLGDGFLSATDPAKRLNETNWQPLSEVLGRIDTAAQPAAAPSEEPASIEVEDAAAFEPEPEQPPASAIVDPKPPAAVNPPQEIEPEPVATVPTPEPPSAPSVVTPLPPATSPPSVPTPFPVAAAAPSAAKAPQLQVSVPNRGRKMARATRTGSLLAKEALQAARMGGGILAPAIAIKANTTAPVPELEPEPAPPRRRPTVKVEEPSPPEVTSPAAPHRKTIRLTGRITLPGDAPQVDPPAPEPAAAPPAAKPRATTTPRLPAAELAKFSGYIATPRHSGKAVAGETPQRQTDSSSPPESSAFAKTSTRKAIKLTGPISLPGQATAPIARLSNDDDEGPMVIARSSRSSRVIPPAPFSSAPLPQPATESPAEPPRVIPSGPVAPLERPAEIAATAAVAAETGVEIPTDASPTSSGPLPSPSTGGDLADRRSLKISGALRQTAPAPGPIQLNSPSVESGPLAALAPIFSLLGAGGSTLEDVRPAPPVPEEDLPPRPPTGKIPVHEMPTEGVKVRTTRRLTSPVPIPASPTESLAHESPPRALPPPLPAPRKIELPVPPQDASPTEPIVPETFAPEPGATEPAAHSKEAHLSPRSQSVQPAESVEPAGPVPVPENVGIPVEAPAPENVAKPEKVRLRRPVKLELSSRSRPQDSGRITLEAFSKLAPDKPAETAASTPSLAAVEAVPAVADGKEMIAAPLPPATPASRPLEGSTPFVSTSEPEIIPPMPTTPAATSGAMALSLPKKLEEPDTQKRRPSSREKPPFAWVFYAIIIAGVLATCVIVYKWHRSGSEAATEPEPAAPVTNEAAAAEPPPSASPPASVAPPATVTPAASAPAPTPVPPAPTVTSPPPSTNPAPAAPASTNAAAAAAPDASRQAGAFVSDGVLRYEHGDLDGAIAAFNQALDLDPKSAAAYYNRGITKAARQEPDLDGAIADYTQAISLDASLAPAYYYRGLARHSRGELDGALADYDQAIQLDAHNALAFFNRGLIRMQKEDVDGAIVDATNALQLNPHLIQSYYDRGLGRLAKGAYDSALDDMRQFCQLAPQDAYTDYARLYVWLIQVHNSQLADANADLSKAMSSGWNGAADGMVTRIAEYLLGQTSEADLIRDSSSEIPLKDQGQRCEVWYFIGMRKLMEGDKGAAIDALRKCIATQKFDYCEYILAKEQLKTLSASDGDAVTGAAPPRATPVTLPPDPGTITPSSTTTP